MQFQPKTEEEITMDQLLPAGEYDFEVFDAKDETSKSGNEMLHLTLKVFEPSGRSVLVHDYLLPDGGFAFKLRHFCGSSLLMQQYEAGELEAWHCTGKRGRAKVKVQQDKAGAYPPKNVIADYVVGNGQASTSAPVEDDDIPF